MESARVFHPFGKPLISEQPTKVGKKDNLVGTLTWTQWPRSIRPEFRSRPDRSRFIPAYSHFLPRITRQMLKDRGKGLS